MKGRRQNDRLDPCHLLIPLPNNDQGHATYLTKHSAESYTNYSIDRLCFHRHFPSWDTTYKTNDD